MILLLGTRMCFLWPRIRFPLTWGHSPGFGEVIQVSSLGYCRHVICTHLLCNPVTPLPIHGLPYLGSLAFRKSASLRCLLLLLLLGQRCLRQDFPFYSRLLYNNPSNPLSGCLGRPLPSLYGLRSPCSQHGPLMCALPCWSSHSVAISHGFLQPHTHGQGTSLPLLGGRSLSVALSLTLLLVSLSRQGFWALPDHIRVL